MFKIKELDCRPTICAVQHVFAMCLCYPMPSMCLPHSASRRTDSFLILILHQWWKKSTFYRILSCISNEKLQHRKRFVSELRWNCDGVRNSMCRFDTWLSHLASQGWGSLPLCLLCPWKGCRRAAFCCGDATASTEQSAVCLLISLIARTVVVSLVRGIRVATEKEDEGGSSFRQNSHIA